MATPLPPAGHRLWNALRHEIIDAVVSLDDNIDISDPYQLSDLIDVMTHPLLSQASRTDLAYAYTRRNQVNEYEESMTNGDAFDIPDRPAAEMYYVNFTFDVHISSRSVNRYGFRFTLYDDILDTFTMLKETVFVICFRSANLNGRMAAYPRRRCRIEKFLRELIRMIRYDFAQLRHKYLVVTDRRTAGCRPGRDLRGQNAHKTAEKVLKRIGRTCDI